ncbi:hypothetical protein [Moritella sp.]|uniref:hypothetical protein n=1 Tax=Moritella sp. TaxID=78556 RepID=UPI001D5570A7|nr:hypothetical protein [Moritella sp.]MCJ8351199.1 hypothetical protein [Moritella sp.]NQZ41481.1 hypothetical protein [Moritella sp.]
MNKIAKKELLARKFTCIEYMTEYVECFNKMIDSLLIGMGAFQQLQQQNPTIEAHNFSAWESRGLPNLEGDRAYAIDALKKAKTGDPSYLSSSAASLRGISKDVDNIGGFGEWWQRLDKKYEDDFLLKLKQAKKIGSNIDYTICGDWLDDEILDEEITGSIDETELLNYLKSNENLDDIS